MTPHIIQQDTGKQENNPDSSSPGTEPTEVTHHHQSTRHCSLADLTHIMIDTTLPALGPLSSEYSFLLTPASKDISKITHWWNKPLGPPLANLQATYCYNYSQGRQKESPSLHRAILPYQPLPRLSPNHPTHGCTETQPLIQEHSIHGPLGSLLPSPNPINITSQLWNFEAPKFGFPSTSSLAAATNTMMHHHHNIPEGMRSISPEDIITFTKILSSAHSVDDLHYIWNTKASANSTN